MAVSAHGANTAGTTIYTTYGICNIDRNNISYFMLVECVHCAIRSTVDEYPRIGVSPVMLPMEHALYIARPRQHELYEVATNDTSWGWIWHSCQLHFEFCSLISEHIVLCVCEPECVCMCVRQYQKHVVRTWFGISASFKTN